MFFFSLSSFIDLVNSVACLFLANKLIVSYRKSGNALTRLFSLFYAIFGTFFLFLGLAFFTPQSPELAQVFFIFAHLFLYFAMAIFLYFFLRIIGWKPAALPGALFSAFLGIVIFIISLNEGGSARLFTAYIGSVKIISWSHGGSLWIRFLVGTSRTILGISTSIYFIFLTPKLLNDAEMASKGHRIGIGIGLLGIAAFFAFILSALPLYDFWIVISAELITITGLGFIYKALSL